MKKKVMVIFGTRPDAIKMAPLILELKRHEQLEVLVCSTWQHKQMLDQVLWVFWITPDYDLDIMEANQTIWTITIKILQWLDPILKKELPDLLLVHWDTTTWFASWLTWFYNQIPVWHIEAWLRTYNKWSPFPEEMNRKLLSSICDLHFCPTNNNKSALLHEGVCEKNIFVTWNTGIDAMKYTIHGDYKFKEEKLNSLDFSIKTILVTAHRRENLWEPLENICNALLSVVQNKKDVQIVFPVHLNPKVQDTVRKILWEQVRVCLLNPLDVEDLHNLMSKSYLIATDSWWIQEEWPYLKKPVLVMRTETERPEAVDAWTVKVIGINKEDIYYNIVKLLDDKDYYLSYQKAVNPYGNGDSTILIMNIIKDYLWIWLKK